ncbi:MAG: hypothetical protein WCG44_01680 [bacterium]
MTQPQAVLPAYAKGGYAAIISILVVLVVIVLVGIATSLLSIGNAQMSLGQSKSENDLALVESCIEDALLYYNNNSTIPASRTNPLGTCSITLDSSTATSVTFTTVGTTGSYTRSVQVSANRVGSVAVVNWIQIN